MPNLGQRLIDKGRVEGQTAGRTERNNELVVKMHNEQMIIDDISKFTGLSKNEIEIILKIN